MSNDDRELASQQRIEERNSLLEIVEQTIADKRKAGLIGRAEISEDDVVLQDPLSTRLATECSLIRESIKFANPRFSAWKRSKETVEKRIENVLKEVTDATNRRQELSDVYATAYQELLPPQTPELLLSIVVPRTEPHALDTSSLGIKEAFEACFLPVDLMSQVDSAQFHDSALFFMIKEAVSRIEMIHERTGGHKIAREFIVKKAILLQDCLRASRQGVSKKTDLIKLASRIVSDMVQLEQADIKQINKSDIQKSIQNQKSMLTALCPPAFRTQVLQTRGLNDFILREAVAEESWKWTASDKELADCEAEKGKNGKRPWSANPDQGSKIGTNDFTYDFLKHRIPTITKSPILFTSPPSSDQYIPSTYPEQGGFSKVFRLKVPEGSTISDTWQIKDVAVKVITPIDSDEHRTCIRLARESRIWSRMKHKNIVPLIGFWENFDESFDSLSFVSPWMDQGNLYEFLEVNSDVDLSQRLRYAIDIACALSYMHNLMPPVTHGDLRAANVLLKDNVVYLCDFGISNILDGSKGLTTDPHGNFRWQAPEQLIDDPVTSTPLKANIRTDMYSFGSVFLEILTGERPWSAVDHSEAEVEKHRMDSPDAIQSRPENINDDYWTLMVNCWRKEPTLRPTANMALHRLTNFLSALHRV